ncbi:MAG: asparagine synthase-related protein [Chloroflexota bacterium]|nr:asparagine synthase-related protein [Chloroflexota bacterium]
MSKICGFIGRNADAVGARAAVQTMIDVLRHESSDQVEQAWFEGSGMAALRHVGMSQRCAKDATGDEALVVAGQIVALRPAAGSLAETGAQLDAASLLRGWHIHGTALPPQVEGDYALAHYDGSSSTLTLANGRYGFCPLYYSVTADGCYFASEAKALIRAIGEAELDWQSVADFFYIGHMLGERTLFRGISALGPGQIVTYRQGRLEAHTYANFTHAPVKAARDISAERIAQLFMESVERRLDRDKPQVVLLSGGLDSRLILGALHQLAVTPRVISLEHDNIRNGADGRYAARIAQRLGFECEVRPTRPDFYGSRECMEVFQILDGMVPTWELFIGQIYGELEPSMGTVWDGLGLDLTLGGTHQFAGGYTKNMAHFLKKQPINRPLLQSVLTPEAFAAADLGFFERVDAELAAIPNSENQFLHFLLKHRIRRRISVNPYQLFGSRIQPQTPSTDLDFLDYVVGVPSSLRLNHAVYAAMVKAHFPILTEVPVISGGSPMYFEQNSSATIGRMLEQARLGLVRTAKRFNIKKRMKYMARQPLKPREQDFARLIISTLAETNFARPFYNQEHLRQLFAQYRAGNILYHDLFAMVFYIELWHQLFLEQVSTPAIELVGAV